jgi:hypothetical protein
MQDVTLNYLGKYSFDDPRSTNSRISNGVESVEKRFWLSTTESIPLNLWTELKFRFFPTGHALSFAVISFVIWFILALKRDGIHQDLALVGLLSTVACIADMVVAIIGDGKYELIKHLFLSNVLFDIGAIVFLNSVLICCLELVGTRLKSNFQKLTAG